MLSGPSDETKVFIDDNLELYNTLLNTSPIERDLWTVVETAVAKVLDFVTTGVEFSTPMAAVRAEKKPAAKTEN